MDPGEPRVDAVAIRGDVIAAVGSNQEIRAFIGPATKVIHLAGRMATPGLVDGHCHLYNLGAAAEAVSLRESTNAADAAAKVARAAAERPATEWGEWIVGRGWDQTRWPSGEFPSHLDLDSAIPDRPVALRRVDGHALWANRAALSVAGITAATQDPPGGRILRDSRGEPTGVLIDAAMGLVTRHIPAPTEAIRRRRIVQAATIAVQNGLTGVHEMGLDDSTVAVYRQLAQNGELPLRVIAYLAGSKALIDDLPRRKPEPPDGKAYFTVRGIKLFTDGALGSRGAALLEPYSDDPGNKGLPSTTPEELDRIVATAVQGGWQLATHAIGDAGNRMALDAYEKAIRARPEADMRLRIEHAQVVALDDLPRFGQLGILASVQPTHATSDMRWAEARVGPERIRGAYAWRSLLDQKARIVAGSDFPVEGVSPLLGIYAAVTRRDTNGNPKGGWYPGQRMTLSEVLHSFTVEPAHAAFVEDHLGRLRVGYAADMTVYDRVLTGDESLLQTQIDLTVVGGRIVFERQ